jgi:hypothetical protein
MEHERTSCFVPFTPAERAAAASKVERAQALFMRLPPFKLLEFLSGAALQKKRSLAR